MELGVASACITPQVPVPLAGFAHRHNRPWQGVDSDLWLKAFWFRAGGADAVLVVADILWWPPERCEPLRDAISHRCHVPVDAVFLHATHTHSAPHASRAFTPGLGDADDSWNAMLDETLLTVVADAQRNLEPVQLSRGVGQCDLAINRRVALGVDPTEADTPDPTALTVLSFGRETNGSRKAVLVHYACHPVINGHANVSADFPGIACERIRQGADVEIVGFLQGACGDINPRCTGMGARLSLTHADVEAAGEAVANASLAVLAGTLERVEVPDVQVTSLTVDAALSDVPTPELLDSLVDAPEPDGDWARVLLASPERIRNNQPLHMSLLSLGQDLQLLAVDAEMVSAYGAHATARSGNSTLMLPYTNGMTAYVVTDAQLARGGYESVESTRYFALPGVFASGLEATVRHGIDELIDAD